MVTAVFLKSLHAIATVFPSMEYVDEKYHEDVFGVKGIALIRPPV